MMCISHSYMCLYVLHVNDILGTIEHRHDGSLYFVHMMMMKKVFLSCETDTKRAFYIKKSSPFRKSKQKKINYLKKNFLDTFIEQHANIDRKLKCIHRRLIRIVQGIFIHEMNGMNQFSILF